MTVLIRNQHFALLILCFLTLRVTLTSADNDSGGCLYVNQAGVFQSAHNLESVPSRFRDGARCYDKQISKLKLTDPSEVEFEGDEAREIIITPLGEMRLKWERGTEKIFNKNPIRATVEAASAVSKALRNAGFPGRVAIKNRKWDIVFFENNISSKEAVLQGISASPTGGCHPGFMQPPTDIYIIAKWVAIGCNTQPEQRIDKNVADAELSSTLIHEFGHSVEYALRGTNKSHSRMFSEGFASWFEIYASKFSKYGQQKAIHDLYLSGAEISMKRDIDYKGFSGDWYDYGRSAMLFRTIEKKKGIRKLLKVYEVALNEKTTIPSAVESVLGWSWKEWITEANKFIQNNILEIKKEKVQIR